MRYVREHLPEILLAIFALCVIAFPMALFAQDGPAMEPLTGETTVPLCVILGPIITAAIQPFKNIPFIKNNSFLLSMIASTVLALSPQLGMGQGATVQAVIACILATLGGATLTHRALIKPVEKSRSSNPQDRALDLAERALGHLIHPPMIDPPTPPVRPRARR